ncbi:hypothetical protein IV72_GL000536 [Atopobium minutum]|nr:hypothetical protein IV72_GL000536 [Atopobium minutum]
MYTVLDRTNNLRFFLVTSLDQCTRRFAGRNARGFAHAHARADKCSGICKLDYARARVRRVNVNSFIVCTYAKTCGVVSRATQSLSETPRLRNKGLHILAQPLFKVISDFLVDILQGRNDFGHAVNSYICVSAHTYRLNRASNLPTRSPRVCSRRSSKLCLAGSLTVYNCKNSSKTRGYSSSSFTSS